jgi:excisionase family DNA binding protein
MDMQADVLAVDIREAARRLTLSPRTVASMVARHELPSLKVGRRRIIPVTALEGFIKRCYPTEPTTLKRGGLAE